MQFQHERVLSVLLKYFRSQKSSLCLKSVASTFIGCIHLYTRTVVYQTTPYGSGKKKDEKEKSIYISIYSLMKKYKTAECTPH